MADFGGRYRLVRRLGAGGMGEVWLARDNGLDGRPVAIKVMRAGMLADPEDVARFQREMRLASRMQHPNIMTVFTTGSHNGGPFMVMEYLEGGDLGKAPPGLDADEVARIGRETCLALAYAHALTPGVVHRDIKPGNLFIRDSGQVKVTDFGIAKALGGTRLSSTGTLIGTFPYMAPEQWLGEPETFGIDVWAMGCVLYELLSGHVPRSYPTATEYAAAAARREPVPALPATVPGWLSDAVMSMLRPDPAGRPTAAQCVTLLAEPPAPLTAAPGRHAAPHAELAIARKLGEARRLAAAADLALASPVTSLQVPIALAIEAMRTTPVFEADLALRHAIRTAAPQLLRADHGGPVRAVAFSPDGTIIATGSTDGCARLLDAATGAEIMRADHGSPVHAVAFSPDGARLATGCGHWPDSRTRSDPDGSARLFDTAAGTQIFQAEHKSQVLSVTFSPDGTQLLTGSGDQNFRVLNAATGTETAILRPDRSALRATVCGAHGPRMVTAATDDSAARVLDVATGAECCRLPAFGRWSRAVFSPNGALIAASTYDRGARVFDAATGAEVSRLESPQGDLMEFTPDGSRIAVSSYRGTVRVLDTATGAEISLLDHQVSLPGGTGYPSDKTLAFSPDGAKVAVSSGPGSARVFDVATGTETARLDPGGPVHALAFSPDGARVAAASDDGSVRVFASVTGPEVARLDHGGSVLEVAFSPDSAKVATVGGRSFARVFDTATGTEAWRAHFKLMERVVSFSPDGRLIVVANNGGYGHCRTRVLDAGTGTEISGIDQHNIVYAAAFSPDSTRVASASRAGQVVIFDAMTGAEVCTLRDSGLPYAAAFSPDGTRVAVGGYRVTVCDAQTGEETWEEYPDYEVYTVAFRPRDGAWLLAAGGDHSTSSHSGGAQVFDAATGTVVSELRHDAHVRTAVFSPDGTQVATASEDRCARVFDAATGTEISRVYHDGAVYGAAFSPDGTQVATASADHTARVFDAATGAEISRLDHGDSVYVVAFSPDGTLIATGSGDGTARLWHASQGQLVEQAAARLTRNLNEQEWRRYFRTEPYRKTREDLP